MQVETLSCDSDMFKMSVMASTGWLAHFFSTQPRMLSGPGSLLIFTLSGIFLSSSVDTDRGQSSGGGADFTADALLKTSKQATIKQSLADYRYLLQKAH